MCLALISPHCGLSFYNFNSLSNNRNPFILRKSNLPTFLVRFMFFVFFSEKFLPKSKIRNTLHYLYDSLWINFFICGTSLRSSFFFWKDCFLRSSFLPKHLCWKMIDDKWVGLFLCSTLFHWSIYVYSYARATVLLIYYYIFRSY